MARSDSLPFDYVIGARSFLARARSALAEFDAEAKPEDLLRAALELRFGIEARLFEYINASLSQLHQEPKRIKEYSATELLARLTRLDPQAGRPIAVKITSEQTGVSSAFRYNQSLRTWPSFTADSGACCTTPTSRTMRPGTFAVELKGRRSRQCSTRVILSRTASGY